MRFIHWKTGKKNEELSHRPSRKKIRRGGVDPEVASRFPNFRALAADIVSGNELGRRKKKEAVAYISDCFLMFTAMTARTSDLDL